MWHKPWSQLLLTAIIWFYRSIFVCGCTINMLSEIVLHHKCLQIATYPKVDFPIFFLCLLSGSVSLKLILLLLAILFYCRGTIISTLIHSLIVISYYLTTKNSCTSIKEIYNIEKIIDVLLFNHWRHFDNRVFMTKYYILQVEYISLSPHLGLTIKTKQINY